MKKFKDRPIKSKLTTFILLSTLLAITALSSVFMIQRYTTFKHQFTEEFTTITKIIADRSNAALLFEDQHGLNETLSSLSLHKDVLIGCTYNAEGSLLAQYNPSSKNRTCPDSPTQGGVNFKTNNLDIAEPILVDEKPAGTIFVSASTQKVKRELETAIYTILGLSSLIILAAFIFASYIQRFISDPLIKLKDETNLVTLDQIKFEPLAKRNEDEVGELVDAFNQMRTTIAKQNAVIQEHTNSLERKVEERTHDLAIANKELEAFSYSVSHDLKAPLRIIEGFSRALEEDYGDKLDETAQDYLSRVRIGTYKMSQLITSLLLLSQVTRQELNKDRIDITELAKLSLNEVRAQDPDRSLIIEVQPNMIALGDNELVQIVLDNLIGNAWKYSQKKSETNIQIGMTEEKGQSVYFIKDNGAGFDMKYADRLLKPFSRLHSPEEFEGSGIGLATVNRIVERHHGKIWVDSEIDQGSTFYFTLFPESSNTEISNASQKSRA